MATQTTDLKEFLQEIAEAIRVKRGHENLLSPQDFVNEIFEIETIIEEEPVDTSLIYITSNTPDYFSLRFKGSFYNAYNHSISFRDEETAGSDAFIGEIHNLVSNSFLILYHPEFLELNYINIDNDVTIILHSSDDCSIVKVGPGVSHIDIHYVLPS